MSWAANFDITPKKSGAARVTGRQRTHQEREVPMGTTDGNPHCGTCRVCHCSIMNQGKGWYHTPERPTATYPGHFAEPLVAYDIPRR